MDIPYNFECRNNIRNLPDHVDELDLVRIIGITFDNAIEVLSSDPAFTDDQTAGPEYTVETPPLNTPDSQQEERGRDTQSMMTPKLRRSSGQIKDIVDWERDRTSHVSIFHTGALGASG